MFNRLIGGSCVGLVVGLCLFALSAAAEPKNLATESVQELKDKRLSVLQQRVTLVQELVDQHMAGGAALWEPQLDLLKVKLEYASSVEEKRSLLNAILDVYEEMLPAKKIEFEHPAGRANEGSGLGREIANARLEYLTLVSEQLRWKISLEELQ